MARELYGHDSFTAATRFGAAAYRDNLQQSIIFTLMDLIDQICSFSSFVFAVNNTD